jgi:two-component system response regulator AtoC
MKLSDDRLSGEMDPSVPPDHVVFGRSEAMRGVRQKVEKVAGANIAVLIQGESGTGKEIIAKQIHARSLWQSGPFVKVSCPAIPGTLMESELFGYERGSFTGANGTKPGRVELAQNGTLFLDEIAEVEPSLQAKLLQLLQDGQFCRIGGQEDKRVEVRVVCATNRNLEKGIQQGTFRRDLFYRINVVNIHLPSLRARAEDIPGMCDFFRQVYSEKFNRPTPPLSARTLDSLQRYEWPGNIRELENVIKRYVVLGSEDAITVQLAEGTTTSSIPDTLTQESISLKKVTRQAVQELESKIILKILQTHNWNRRRAASALNISYRALLYKLKQAGMTAREDHGNAQSSEMEGN